MSDVIEENRNGPSGTEKTPADFLQSIKGKHVIVKLNSGVNYKGMLACLDGYMNIAMEQTEVRCDIHGLWTCHGFEGVSFKEYVDGQLKNHYGDCFIRGNNVLYIAASQS